MLGPIVKVSNIKGLRLQVIKKWKLEKIILIIAHLLDTVPGYWVLLAVGAGTLVPPSFSSVEPSACRT